MPILLSRPVRFLSTKTLMVALGLALGLPGAWWLWTQLKPYESHPVADTFWSRWGESYAITYRVQDESGRPMPEVCIDSVDSFGGDSGMTDQNGEWVCRVDGPLGAFRVNGVPVLRERAITFAGEPGKKGWLVTVVVKDPVALSRWGR